ncbi:MAG: hypothetical protein H7644_14630 [Candidatus Heimdallarchaeota archaeon]|nr:hypothetical protein [Candidatus Heimdallarchaeota archaeon]MCK5144998.1 hypothetical protein [Candidatus Heimdallarchaeota archaeon]
MDNRTKRRILESLFAEETTETRILGYRYEIEYYNEDDIVIASPVGAGDTVYSSIEYDDHRYIHGGRVYRAVLEFIKELDEAYRLFAEGKQ